MSRPSVRRAIFATLLGAWFLVACSGSGGPRGATNDRDVIAFGAAISITGPTFKEGEYTRDGYQFYIDTINARGGIQVGSKPYKVKLVYYDDQSDPQITAQLYETLVQEDKVDFLLGPYGSGPTGTAAPVAEKYQIPMVEANGAAESIFSKGYRYTFGLQTPAKHYLRGVLDAVLTMDSSVKTVAILGENEPFSREVAAGVAEYAPSRGLDVVYQELYPTGTTDVSALLTEVKARNPDVLLGTGHLQDALLIVRQSKEQRVSPKAMGFSVGPSSPEFRKNLRSNADYIFGATQWTAALKYVGDDPWKTPQAYAAAFKSEYPQYTDIPYHVAESSAALVTYQKALEKARTFDRQAVRDTLASLDVMTFFGRIKFDERGVDIYKPMAVEQLQPDGNKYTVFPLDVAEKPMVYPMVAWDKR